MTTDQALARLEVVANKTGQHATLSDVADTLRAERTRADMAVKAFATLSAQVKALRDFADHLKNCPACDELKRPTVCLEASKLERKIFNL